MMKKYIVPEIMLLLFDEEEIITDSIQTRATYADKLIQQYTFGDDRGHGDGVGVGSSVSIRLQKIGATPEPNN